MSQKQSVIVALAEAKAGPPLGVDYTRHVASESPAQRLASVFAEVDATILPRALTFKNGKDLFQIEAGSRRLYMVTDAVVAQAPKPSALALSRRDEVNLADQVSQIAALLSAFVNQAGQLTVTVAEPNGKASSAEVGFNTQEMKLACGRLEISSDLDVVAAEQDAEDVAEVAVAPVAAAPAPVAPPVAEAPAASPVPEVEPAPAKPKPAEIQDSSRAGMFLAASQKFAKSGAGFNHDGTKSEEFGTDPLGMWDSVVPELGPALSVWLQLTEGFLGKTQMIVFKGPKFDDQSLALFLDHDRVGAAVFNNVDMQKAMGNGMALLGGDDE